MNLSLKLLRNRLPLILIITLEICLYFSLIPFIYRNNNIEIIFHLDIILWVLLSYLLGRYHLKKLNYLILIKYIFKSLLIYLIILLINNICEIENVLINLFGFLSISIHIIFLRLNYNYYNGNIKWITNDFRLANFYNSSRIIFKNNFIHFYNKDINYKLQDYKGFIINKNLKNSEKFESILKENKNMKIYTSLQWCEYFLEALPFELMEDVELFKSLERYSSKNFYFFFKRIFESVASLIIFIICVPIIIFFIILIYLQDGLPLFYSQIRTGINKNKIKIFKIRSMRKDSEINGPQWSSNNDPRITFIGKLIRKNRIDELPQLLSVLKGDLCLIGPRPERPEIDRILEEEIGSYSKRYIVKPGITGWAQVNYPYGASIQDSKIKQCFDIYYVKNVSFILDLIIFLKTIRLVLNGKGAKPFK